MEPVLVAIHRHLIKKKQTVATAESCTAGLLSYLLTRLPGSSGYFLMGLLTYSNRSKEELLRIPHAFIIRNGAVSEAVATKMAHSARVRAHADYGIGITGIAGPAGGTLAKPVGTVFIAVSSRKKTLCRKFIFKGSRDKVRSQSAYKALQLLLGVLKS
jgi:PncC family amidohydrolase